MIQTLFQKPLINLLSSCLRGDREFYPRSKICIRGQPFFDIYVIMWNG